LCDQLDALPIVTAAHDVDIRRSGAQVDTGRPCVEAGVGVRTSGEIAGSALGRLELDLSGPVQLRRIRIQGPLSLPIVKKPRWLLLLLHSFAPPPRRLMAVLPP